MVGWSRVAMRSCACVDTILVMLCRHPGFHASISGKSRHKCDDGRYRQAFALYFAAEKMDNGGPAIAAAVTYASKLLFTTQQTVIRVVPQTVGAGR
jgi:hypothetical protein